MPEASVPSPKALAEQFPGVVTGDRMAAPANPKGGKGRFEPLKPMAVEPWPHGSDLETAFNVFAPWALYIATPDRPVVVGHCDRNGNVERWFGGDPTMVITEDGPKPLDQVRAGERIEGRFIRNHPGGVWVAKIGINGSYKDTVTRSLPKDAFVSWGLRRRIWVRGIEDNDDADKLLTAVMLALRVARAEQNATDLPHGWVDVGPRFSPYRFERDFVLPAARALGIWAKPEEDPSQGGAARGDTLKTFLLRALDKAFGPGGGGWRAFKETCEALIEREWEDGSRHMGRSGRSAGSAGGHPARGYSLRQPIDPDTERQIEEVLREKRMRQLQAADGQDRS